MASEHQQPFRLHKYALCHSQRAALTKNGFLIDLKGASITPNQHRSIAFIRFPARGFSRSRCSSGSTLSSPSPADSHPSCSPHGVTARIQLREDQLAASFLRDRHQSSLVFRLLCSSSICARCSERCF